MITHIVLFAFNPTQKQANLLEAKKRLEALKMSIDTIIHLEVGINFTQSTRAFDLSLIVTFKTREDLDTYAVHPKHLEVVEFIKSVTHTSHVVDYES